MCQLGRYMSASSTCNVKQPRTVARQMVYHHTLDSRYIKTYFKSIITQYATFLQPLIVIGWYAVLVVGVMVFRVLNTLHASPAFTELPSCFITLDSRYRTAVAYKLVGVAITKLSPLPREHFTKKVPSIQRPRDTGVCIALCGGKWIKKSTLAFWVACPHHVPSALDRFQHVVAHVAHVPLPVQVPSADDAVQRRGTSFVLLHLMARCIRLWTATHVDVLWRFTVQEILDRLDSLCMVGRPVFMKRFSTRIGCVGVCHRIVWLFLVMRWVQRRRIIRVVFGSIGGVDSSSTAASQSMLGRMVICMGCGALLGTPLGIERVLIHRTELLHHIQRATQRLKVGAFSSSVPAGPYQLSRVAVQSTFGRGVDGGRTGETVHDSHAHHGQASHLHST
eukprot:m.16175 g.16175  ORF g.16175 m.16175 type:complete len:392 (+) comp3363_c0_seq1:36-1211(+)